MRYFYFVSFGHFYFPARYNIDAGEKHSTLESNPASMGTTLAFGTPESRTDNSIVETRTVDYRSDVTNQHLLYC